MCQWYRPHSLFPALFFLLIAFFSAKSLVAQEIDPDFFSFPEELIPDLTTDQRVRLAQTRSFHFPATDERELAKYDLETEGPGHFKIRLTMLSGQSGFFTIEFRRFSKSDGNSFWLYSKYGGTRAVFEQHELFALERINGAWMRTPIPGLPDQVDNSIFAIGELGEADLTRLNSWSSYMDIRLADSEEIAFLLFPVGKLSEEAAWHEEVRWKWSENKFVRTATIPNN